MDDQKKQELAEMDSRWEFKKTVKTPNDISWTAIKDKFNEIQSEQGDLYMEVSKMPLPGRIGRCKMWIRERSSAWTGTTTFHHSQVYEWFESVAHNFDTTIGEAIHMVFNNPEKLREELDLGDTMNVEINSMEEMTEPEESKVSKDELEEMISDD